MSTFRSGDNNKMEEVLESWEDAADYGVPGLDRRIRESLTQSEKARNDRKLLMEEHFNTVASHMPNDAGDGMPVGPIRMLKRPQPRSDEQSNSHGGPAVPIANGAPYPSITERYAAYNEVRLRIFGSHDPDAAAHLRDLQSGTEAAHSSKHDLP